MNKNIINFLKFDLVFIVYKIFKKLYNWIFNNY